VNIPCVISTIASHPFLPNLCLCVHARGQAPPDAYVHVCEENTCDRTLFASEFVKRLERVGLRVSEVLCVQSTVGIWAINSRTSTQLLVHTCCRSEKRPGDDEAAKGPGAVKAYGIA
jgi:hypothetical protein